MEEKTLGELIAVADAQLVIIHDRWYGMHPAAPFLATYELRRDSSAGFAGDGRLSTATSEPRDVSVSLSRAAAAKFLRALTEAVVVPGAYEPLCTHTDDFPSIELALHVRDSERRAGIALLFTTSQGEFHAPWGACINGGLYTVPGEAVGRALRELHRPLQRHLLDEMIRAGKDGETSGGDGAPIIDRDALLAEAFEALWLHGPLEKDAAIRRCAEHLRQKSIITYQRLRTDGANYVGLLALLEAAVKEGLLDRPRRGYVRACKKNASAYSADDWRQVLLASIGSEPVEREEALRGAAVWAREHVGLVFSRLRLDGHIGQGLRSALNSAIRRGEIVRHGARLIARADIVHDAAPAEPYAEESDADASVPDSDADAISDAAPVEIVRLAEPRHFDGNESVLALQFGAQDSTFAALSLALIALEHTLRAEGLPHDTTTWRFFLGMDRPHVEGLTTWVAVSKSVPAQVVDLLQRLLEANVQRVQREYAAVAHHELVPFLVATESGIEVASSGETMLDDRDVTELGIPHVVRRPFVVDTARSTADTELRALLFGDG